MTSIGKEDGALQQDQQQSISKRSLSVVPRREDMTIERLAVLRESRASYVRSGTRSRVKKEDK